MHHEQQAGASEEQYAVSCPRALGRVVPNYDTLKGFVHEITATVLVQ